MGHHARGRPGALNEVSGGLRHAPPASSSARAPRAVPGNVRRRPAAHRTRRSRPRRCASAPPTIRPRRRTAVTLAHSARVRDPRRAVVAGRSSRLAWRALPADVRRGLERRLGSPVREALDQSGGFARGVSGRTSSSPSWLPCDLATTLTAARPPLPRPLPRGWRRVLRVAPAGGGGRAWRGPARRPRRGGPPAPRPPRRSLTAVAAALAGCLVHESRRRAAGSGALQGAHGRAAVAWLWTRLGSARDPCAVSAGHRSLRPRSAGAATQAGGGDTRRPRSSIRGSSVSPPA